MERTIIVKNCPDGVDLAQYANRIYRRYTKCAKRRRPTVLLFDDLNLSATVNSQ